MAHILSSLPPFLTSALPTRHRPTFWTCGPIWKSCRIAMVIQWGGHILSRNEKAPLTNRLPRTHPVKDWRGAACAAPLHLKLNISYQGSFLYCLHNLGQFTNLSGGRFYFLLNPFRIPYLRGFLIAACPVPILPLICPHSGFPPDPAGRAGREVRLVYRAMRPGINCFPARCGGIPFAR